MFTEEEIVEYITGKMKLSLSFEDAICNPTMEYNEGWSAYACHYKVRIRNRTTGKSMRVYFSKGDRLPYGVKIKEVLYSLVCDAMLFEDDFNGLGPVSDFLRAGVEKQTKKFKNLIGGEVYDTVFVRGKLPNE